MEKIFTKQYQIRYYEADFTGTVRPVTLLDYLQDTAASHSRGSGVSVADLRKNNMTWVLSRYHVLLLRYPQVGDNLQVRTWRSKIEGHFALREFEVKDAAGCPLVLATSSWVIVNLATKRPVRIDSVVSGLPLLERRALDDDFKSLTKLEESCMEQSYRVRAQDMDLNRHVNNTVYAGWTLETVPDDILFHYRPAEIEIAYRGEAFHGDTVIVRTGQPGGENPCVFVHQVANVRDGRELTRLRTSWKRI